MKSFEYAPVHHISSAKSGHSFSRFTANEGDLTTPRDEKSSELQRLRFRALPHNDMTPNNFVEAANLLNKMKEPSPASGRTCFGNLVSSEVQLVHVALPPRAGLHLLTTDATIDFEERDAIFATKKWDAPLIDGLTDTINYMGQRPANGPYPKPFLGNQQTNQGE